MRTFHAASVVRFFGFAAILAAVGLLLIGMPSVSKADDGPAPDDSVFQWSDVPQNQNIPITRATFDQGGYQLYDTQGETIVVPFTNNNLYVMQFGRSDDGTTYFVNSNGSVPVLYVPEGGYVENATIPGARWYPFPPDYTPEAPVYVGIAPSWAVFVDMGWYPDMVCYGGYWGRHAYWEGGLFIAFPGLFFEIGGVHYYGWSHYHDYYRDHPGWRHVDYHDRNVYRVFHEPSRRDAWDQRHPDMRHDKAGGDRRDNGGPHNDTHGSVNGGRTESNGPSHVFRGAGGNTGGEHGSGGGTTYDNHAPSAGGNGGRTESNGPSHVFRGAGGNAGGEHGSGGGTTYDNHAPSAGGNGGRTESNGPSHVFRGAGGNTGGEHGSGGETTYDNHAPSAGGPGSAGSTHSFHGADSGQPATGGYHGGSQPTTGGGNGSQHTFQGSRGNSSSHDSHPSGGDKGTSTGGSSQGSDKGGKGGDQTRDSH